MDNRDKELIVELQSLSVNIARQIADKCIQLDDKYKVSSDSMKGYLIYCIFKDQLDLPVIKHLAKFDVEQE